MFAELPPDGQLNPHRDPFAGSLRYHLGLSTPNDDGCHIIVDGEPYSWREAWCSTKPMCTRPTTRRSRTASSCSATSSVRRC